MSHRVIIATWVGCALLLGAAEGTAKTVIPVQKIQIKAVIYFPTHSVRVSAASRLLLDRIGKALRAHKALTLVEVAGHCTPREIRYGRRTGQIRARSVARYLVKRWRISPKRLVVKGYGDSRPVAPNRTARGRAKNRRVDFRVLRVSKKSAP